MTVQQPAGYGKVLKLDRWRNNTEYRAEILHQQMEDFYYSKVSDILAYVHNMLLVTVSGICAKGVGKGDNHEGYKRNGIAGGKMYRDAV